MKDERERERIRACNETKSEEMKKTEKRAGGEGSEKTKERRNEWHTASEESGQLLYNNKGHVGRKRDGGERDGKERERERESEREEGGGGGGKEGSVCS